MTSKAIFFAALASVLVLFGFQSYEMHSTRKSVQTQLEELENKIQTIQDSDARRTAELTTDLKLANERIGVASQDILKQAERATNAIRKEQTRTVAELHDQLQSQVEEHAKAVNALRDEATAKLDEYRQDTSKQLGSVNGDVKNVSGQVERVKTDLASALDDIAASRRELGDVRDSLGRQIAHNEQELSILKRRGERNYYEFDIAKSNAMQKVGDIKLQLTKADVKSKKYDVSMLVADDKLSKKGQIINEPVPLLVGKDHVRYELVVNTVEKDRIRGYLSTPKEMALNVEGPAIR